MSASMSDAHYVRHRVLLASIAKQLTQDEINGLAFIWLRGRTDIDDFYSNENGSTGGLKLFVRLERFGIISSRELDGLLEIVKSINRLDLVDMIQSFITRNCGKSCTKKKEAAGNLSMNHSHFAHSPRPVGLVPVYCRAAFRTAFVETTPVEPSRPPSPSPVDERLQLDVHMSELEHIREVMVERSTYLGLLISGALQRISQREHIRAAMEEHYRHLQDLRLHFSLLCSVLQGSDGSVRSHYLQREHISAVMENYRRLMFHHSLLFGVQQGSETTQGVPSIPHITQVSFMRGYLERMSDGSNGSVLQHENSQQHLSSIVEIFNPYTESEQRQVEGNAPSPGMYIAASASLHDDFFSFRVFDDMSQQVEHICYREPVMKEGNYHRFGHVLLLKLPDSTAPEELLVSIYLATTQHQVQVDTERTDWNGGTRMRFASDLVTGWSSGLTV